MPQCNQYDRANKCMNEWDTVEIGILKTSNINDDDFCHQPDTDQCQDDCADEAERQSPANNHLSYKTDNTRNYQVNDKVEAEVPNIVTNFDGNPICQNEILMPASSPPLLVAMY